MKKASRVARLAFRCLCGVRLRDTLVRRVVARKRKPA